METQSLGVSRSATGSHNTLMPSMQNHLRNTFLAGILAAVPIAVTAFIVWWVDMHTRAITVWLFKREIPAIGILVALAAIYAIGLLATSLIGRSLLRLVDRALGHVPILRQVYAGWKQIALTPGATEGTFSKVAMIPDETGQTLLLGFTSGRSIEGDPATICVFVPSAPNPVTGRLYFVRRENCQLVEVSTEEAFKVILSTGNYTPPQLGQASIRAFS